MPYAFLLDTPVPAEAYKAVNDQVRAKLNGRTPDGLIAHVVWEHDGCMRHVDVWESRAHWDAFEPIVASIVGESPTGGSFTEIAVIDTWLGNGNTDAPIGFIHHVPANTEMYEKIRAGLPSEAPEGLVAHIVQVLDDGLRYVDVWQSSDLWFKFKNVTLVPVVSEVLAGYGIPHTEEGVTIEQVAVVDTWFADSRKLDQ